MKTLHLFFSHQLTDVQNADAVAAFGVMDFKPLPEELQQRFSYGMLLSSYPPK